MSSRDARGLSQMESESFTIEEWTTFLIKENTHLNYNITVSVSSYKTTLFVQFEENVVSSKISKHLKESVCMGNFG